MYVRTYVAATATDVSRNVRTYRGGNSSRAVSKYGPEVDTIKSRRDTTRRPAATVAAAATIGPYFEPFVLNCPH